MSEQSMRIEKQENTTEDKKAIPWWKKLGIAGFLFFLIKGLIWIAVFVIGYIWGPEALDSIKAFFQNLF